LTYNTQNLALTVRQPLFNKETIATYRSAQALVKSQRGFATKRDFCPDYRISGAYFELLYAQEKTTVLQSKIVALQQQLDQATQRFTHGEGTLTEISEAQASLDIAQADLVEARNTADSYRLTLSTMSGHEVGDLARFNPEKILTIKTDLEHIDYWLKAAIENNPEIMAAKQAVEVAQQEVEKKQAGTFSNT